MSFHWNLSSSSEDEFQDDQLPLNRSTFQFEAGGESDSQCDPNSQTNVPTLACHVQGSITGGGLGVATLQPPYYDSASSEESDDDIVDWEDVDDQNAKLPAETIPLQTQLQPITIDLGAGTEQKKVSSRKRERKTRRHVYSFKSLPADLRVLLLNVQRAHMLSLTSRAILISRCSSDEELVNVAHSLIPSKWAHSRMSRHKNDAQTVPPKKEAVRELCFWWFGYVNQVEERRRVVQAANIAAGAPSRRKRRDRMTKNHIKAKKNKKISNCGVGRTMPRALLDICSYLSATYDENPQLLCEEDLFPSITDIDKTQILVAIARSLGWRVRYVTALQPLKRDLDMEHPLFLSGIKNIFQAVNKQMNTVESHKRKHKKRNKGGKTEPDTFGLSDERAAVPIDTVAWVEILCGNNKTSKPTSIGSKESDLQWVHVDTAHELWDSPKDVESLLPITSHGGKRKKKPVISYALAVEQGQLHELVERDIDNMCCLVRLTDVTPRYANAWSNTLIQRGATRTEIIASNGKYKDKWWTDTIQQANRSWRSRAKTLVKILEIRSIASNGADLMMLSSKDKSAGTYEMATKIENRQVVTWKVGMDTDIIVLDDSSDEQKSTPQELGESSKHDDSDLDAADQAEEAELLESTSREALPTSKVTFKNHPLYALKSGLNSSEILALDAKRRVCGLFKGELIYKRSDVSTAMTAKKWMYNGRKVKDKEMNKPVIRVKARKKPTPKGFNALQSYGVGTGNDGSKDAATFAMKQASIPLDEYNGMNELYAVWQTRSWSPPRVEPHEAIPVNEYKNVELELLNPGLVHLEEPRICIVAKKLSIPYAPCLTGFEGNGGNRTPSIRGIVVHQPNVALLREAYTEFQSQAVEQEYINRHQQILKRWKKLIVGIVTKDRLEREYGDN